MGRAGIGLYSSNNTVIDDYLSNEDTGVVIGNASSGNVIGGTTNSSSDFRERNSISALRVGIAIEEFSSNNIIEGNAIGTDNSLNTFGIFVDSSANQNTIGGTAAGAGNLITGNKVGIEIFSANNVVEGNTMQIGITGVDIQGTNNTFGGTAAGDGNFLDINSGTGVVIDSGAIGTIFQGNDIERNGVGVEIQAPSITLGGTTVGAGNLIFGNTNQGVLIAATATGAIVEGNQIDNGPTTFTPAGNGVGVEVDAAGAMIGGSTAGASNLISGNTNQGILVDSSAGPNQVGGVSNVTIEGNKIGTDVSGTVALGNGTDGVEIEGQNSIVGGTLASGADANIIAFNGSDGVLVLSGANDDAIRQNAIFANGHLGIELGTNPSGLFAPGNNGEPAPTLNTPAAYNAGTKTLTITGIMPATLPTASIVASAFDFFANLNNESQGRLYLGTPTKFTVSPAKSGQIPFTAVFTFSATTTPSVTTFTAITNPMITATFTDPNGNTSAFSNAVVDPVLAAPAFISPKAAAFTVNTPGSFTVATSGFPAPTLTLSGALPKGLTFNAATGVLSGTPVAGTSGTHILHFTAKNGFGAAVTQVFTLTVEKLVTSVAVPTQVSVTAPVKVTALGHNRFEAVFTVVESAASSLAGQLTIAGFTNLPAGVTFASSTAAAIPAKAKKLTLMVVFTNTTTTSLATLLAGLSPIVEDVSA